MKTFGGSPLNMIAVALSLLWKFSTPLRQTATHLFVLLPLGAYIVHILSSSPLRPIANIIVNSLNRLLSNISENT